MNRRAMATSPQIEGLDPGLYQPLPDVGAPTAPAPESSTTSAPASAGVDPHLLQQLEMHAGPVGDQASASGVDPHLLQQLDAAASGGSGPGSAPTPHVHPHAAPAHHGPTQFQKASAPAPASEPELSLGDTLHQAGQNLLPSLGGAASSLVSAVTHPVDTAKSVLHLGQGFLSQGAGAIGLQQDPAEKAKAEETAKALEQHFANYGSWKNFKHMLGTDPAGVAMDASMLLDPAAGALGKVGEVGRLGAVADAAKLASKTLRYANPVHTALAIAKAPGAVASWAGRGVGSVTSRVPLSALKLATQIGRDGDTVAQTAFSRFARGEGDATEIQRLAQQKLADIRQTASDQYLAGKSNLADVKPSFQPIDSAIADARSRVQMGGPQFQQAAGQFPEANQAVDTAEGMINAYRGSPAHTGLYGIDNLKQALYDLADNYKAGSAANTAVMNIYHGARQSLVDADRGYADLMENYQAGRNNINDLTKTLALGNKAAATSTLTKSLRALKTGTGENLLQQLMVGNPELRGALAGAAINPWSQHASIWEALAGASIPGMLAHPLAAAGFLPGAAAGWAASSPRVVGSAANLAGKLGRNLDNLESPVANAATKGAYYAGRAEQQDQLTEPPAPPTPAPTNSHDIFQKMLHIESRGHQTDARGHTVTSPKGALGIAQVMPQTGPEAAALAGEPWSLERLKTDAEYNERLGRAYFGHLVDMFGDPTLAAAAYNAGPGRVKQALAQAAKAGDEWTRHLPAETQDYVRNIAAASGGRIERADGGKVSDDKLEALVQRLMNKAKHAKRTANQVTKPLLKVNDNIVAKALEVAQRSI